MVEFIQIRDLVYHLTECADILAKMPVTKDVSHINRHTHIALAAAQIEYEKAMK